MFIYTLFLTIVYFSPVDVEKVDPHIKVAAIETVNNYEECMIEKKRMTLAFIAAYPDEHDYEFSCEKIRVPDEVSK